MKKLVLVVLGLSLAVSNVMAAEHVRGYVRRDGTYVAPHYRSESNNSKYDNYSTQGNFNPYTGEKGYVDPYASSYGSNNSPYGSNNNSSIYGGRESIYGNDRNR